MDVKVKKLCEDAQLPTRNNESDAGADLRTIESYLLKAGERKLFKTGISVSIPYGCYGRIAPRSGLAYKYGIDTLGGVIDSGFLGEVGVILLNTSGENYQVVKGDKIAQLIIERCFLYPFIEVEGLDETDRGEKGFGSSGK